MEQERFIRKAVKNAVEFDDRLLTRYLISYFKLQKKSPPKILKTLRGKNIKFETSFEENKLNHLRGEKLLLAKIKRLMNQNNHLKSGKEILIEIILPVFNGEKFLDRLLSSIQKQGYDGPLVISAANNRSTDSSLKILRRWKIPTVRAFKYQRIGYAQSLAIKRAQKFFPFLSNSKRIFLFLDQDTYLARKSYLLSLAKIFRENDDKMVLVQQANSKIGKITSNLFCLFYYLLGFGPRGLISRVGNFATFFSTHNLAIRGSLLETLRLKDYLSLVMVDDVFVSFVLNEWLPQNQIAINAWKRSVVHTPYPQNKVLLLSKWIRKYWVEFFVTKLIYQEWKRDFFGEQKLTFSLFNRLPKVSREWLRLKKPISFLKSLPRGFLEKLLRL